MQSTDAIQSFSSTNGGPGALAVGLSQAGVLAVANAAKPSLMASFGALSIPDPSSISATIPNLGSSTSATIKITGGKFTPSNLSLSNLKQSAGGTFSVDAVLTGYLQFSNWHEDDTTTFTGSGQGPPPQPTHSHFDSSAFKITFQSISLSLSITMSLKNNTLSPHVGNTAVTGTKFNFNLPSETALTSSLFSCVTDKIKSEISSKIGQMTDNIVSSVHTGLDAAFSAIPDSGKLTSDITYLFPGTAGGLAFPNNDGMQYRVLGKVQWKGQDAPGNVGAVPFPAIPTTHHAMFFVNNYDFNALFWAFYKEGKLNFSFNKGNVNFEPALNTDYYNGTPLQAIPTKYPHQNMIIDLSLQTPPTTLVEANEAQVTYSAIVTYWVAKAGTVSQKEAELFSMNLMEIDSLASFAVATNSRSLQLVTFHVSTVKELTSSIIKSNIPNLDKPTLDLMWKFILHPVYTDVLDKAAQTGVPLPCTLQGIFTNYDIKFNTGYASIAVNLTDKSKYAHVLKEGHGVDLNELPTPYPNLAIM